MLRSGVKIVDVCVAGDDYVLSECKRVYKSAKKMEKGLAFPTCISVNNVVGHLSPFANDIRELKEGDLVKVDVGVHIDGYIGVMAHTVLVHPQSQIPTAVNPLTGKRANLLLATQTIHDTLIRMLRPGNTNSQISAAIQRICAVWDVRPVAGVLSHRMDRFVIDSKECILNRATGEGEVEQKVEEHTFKVNDVYALDIVLSSGEVLHTYTHTHTHTHTHSIRQHSFLPSFLPSFFP